MSYTICHHYKEEVRKIRDRKKKGGGKGEEKEHTQDSQKHNAKNKITPQKFQVKSKSTLNLASNLV